MSLKALAVEGEALVLALTPEQREQVLESFRKILEAAQGLDCLPQRLVQIVGLVAMEGLLKYKAGWKLETLAIQLISGSPRLLEPNRAYVEDFIVAIRRK